MTLSGSALYEFTTNQQKRVHPFIGQGHTGGVRRPGARLHTADCDLLCAANEAPRYVAFSWATRSLRVLELPEDVSMPVQSLQNSESTCTRSARMN